MRPLLYALLALALVPAARAQTPDAALDVRRNDQPTTGLGLFRVDVNGGTVAGGTYDGGTAAGGIPVEGAGTRLMWYPQKAAFRAGYVDGTQWNDPNIGYFSVAVGQGVRASGDNSAAFGLRSVASGISTFAAGENNSATGAASVALGYHAHTNARQGTFVFADRSSVDTLRAGVNHSANWRTSGGFRVFTSSNLSTGVTIQSGASVSNWGQSNAVISTSTGAYLSTGGVWTNSSDRNRKHNVLSVDGEAVLGHLRVMPVSTWEYTDEAGGVRHMGPMAQDFHAAFGLGGSDSTHIGSVDADGVALVAVQALEARTRALADAQAELALAQAALAARTDEVTALRAEVDALRAERSGTETRLARIEAALAAPPPATIITAAATTSGE